VLALVVDLKTGNGGVSSILTTVLLLLLPPLPPPCTAPNLAAFGSTEIKVLMGLAGVVPIILNCYVGHQSVHGIMGMLKPYTPGVREGRGSQGVFGGGHAVVVALVKTQLWWWRRKGAVGAV
jgi:hypothetical protein